KEVLKINPYSILVLVGTGQLEKEVQNKAIRLGVLDNIIMLGNRNDIPELLSASDGFIFPSFYEGFPNAVLEAQTSGLPCLISDTITKEVIVNENCENISLDKNPIDWANRLMSLKLCENRTSAAFNIKQNGFSVKDEISKLED